MTAQIAALSESFSALRACKRSLSGVFPKMVTKVTAFLEDGAAATVSTLEVKFYSHCFWVSHFDGLVPVAGDSFKCLRFGPELGSLAWALFSSAAFFNLMSKKFCFFF